MPPASATPLRRLGLVRLSAIGDVVHALPLAAGLHRAFPQARLTWVVQAQAAPLLYDHPAVDDVLVFPRRGGLRAWRRFVRALRARRLQATVDPQGNFKSGLVGLLSGATVRAGQHWRDCKESLSALLRNRQGRPSALPHAVDRAWAAGEPLGVRPAPDEWGVRATAGEVAAWRSRCRRAGADPDRPMTAMHLTDPEDARSWFADAWRETARRLVAEGCQVVLNGTAERRPLAAGIAGPGVFDLTGTDDLRGLLAQLQDLAARPGNVLVSPDSGPLHLAVAAGLPVVCLSGPQDPARTGPRRGAVVRAWEGLDCAPCLERTCQLDPPDRLCMRRIEPAAVVAAVRRVSRPRRTPSRPRPSAGSAANPAPAGGWDGGEARAGRGRSRSS